VLKLCVGLFLQPGATTGNATKRISVPFVRFGGVRSRTKHVVFDRKRRLQNDCLGSKRNISHLNSEKPIRATYILDMAGSEYDQSAVTLFFLFFFFYISFIYVPE
jgi:hypothetical protein